MKTYAVVFLSVFLAELGDKTQLATLFFATNPAVNKVGVFVAAAGALVVSSLLAVAIGAQLGAWLPPERLKILGGLGFIAIGLWMLLAR
ncbi:MAG TPA: TMEM165/GDT1 family protein [Methylomirabilota bacterium]|jgi:putative Ca2+/H+ antiporter (TMEM165/GDT1 family)|nr:TMEM165/GDT1 family protein [Methylomirabilota bacterium]